MVIFNQLRISDDGKRMYINLHVNNASYFDDIYLDKITIMTADYVSEAAPELFTNDYIYQQEIKGEQKTLDLVLQAADFNERFTHSDLTKDLFFVYVKCKGVPDPCVPCTMDEMTTLGVTFDDIQLHQIVMGYTKDLLKDCTVPTGFTNFILLWNAFKAAIETEHYVPAIKFWKLLFSNNSTPALGNSKSCGCHG